MVTPPISERAYARGNELVTLPDAMYNVFTRCRYEKLWSFIVGPLFPERAVGAFVEGTLAYTLSATFNDLITSYIFSFKPEPYCEPSSVKTCSNADSSTFFLYTTVLLIPASFVKHMSMTKSLAWVPSIETVPPMIGMVVGWGLGDAVSAQG